MAIPASSRSGKYNNKVGQFTPNNPDRYRGKYPIIFKSLLEAKMMLYLDINENVKSWTYEPLSIEYIDHSSKKRKRRYWIDFMAEMYVNNVLKRVWIETKSSGETKRPTNKRNSMALLESTKTYIKNVSKWKAAQALAKKHGAEFMIITEEFFKRKR